MPDHFVLIYTIKIKGVDMYVGYDRDNEVLLAFEFNWKIRNISNLRSVRF